MRSVYLGPVAGEAPLALRPRIAHKMRHLRDRMEEFLPDGMTVESGITDEGWGFVHIRVPKLEGTRGADVLLRAHGITSCPVAADGMLRFLVSDRASFEDMDYVQGAVTELFSL